MKAIASQRSTQHRGKARVGWQSTLAAAVLRPHSDLIMGWLCRSACSARSASPKPAASWPLPDRSSPRSAPR